MDISKMRYQDPSHRHPWYRSRWGRPRTEAQSFHLARPSSTAPPTLLSGPPQPLRWWVPPCLGVRATEPRSEYQPILQQFPQSLTHSCVLCCKPQQLESLQLHIIQEANPPCHHSNRIVKRGQVSLFGGIWMRPVVGPGRCFKDTPGEIQLTGRKFVLARKKLLLPGWN